MVYGGGIAFFMLKSCEDRKNRYKFVYFYWVQVVWAYETFYNPKKTPNQIKNFSRFNN